MEVLHKIYDLDVAYQLFFYAIVIDFFTGILVAGRNGKLRSRSCSDGLFRSIGEMIVLSILVLINNLVPTTETMITTLAFGFLFKEGLSICENLIKLGVYVPASIKRLLEVGVDNVENIDKKEGAK